VHDWRDARCLEAHQRQLIALRSSVRVHLHFFSALGGSRTPNLLIRSREHGVLHMSQRCLSAGYGRGDTLRPVKDWTRCYMDCYRAARLLDRIKSPSNPCW
jgi:hypothetical protein